MLKSVSDYGLLGMCKGYYARNVMDSTQWIVLIKQGGHTKAVHFSNYFPAEITHFAGSLDDILAESGVDQETWSSVSFDQYSREKRELWSAKSQ